MIELAFRSVTNESMADTNRLGSHHRRSGTFEPAVARGFLSPVWTTLNDVPHDSFVNNLTMTNPDTRIVVIKRARNQKLKPSVISWSRRLDRMLWETQKVWVYNVRRRVCQRSSNSLPVAVYKRSRITCYFLVSRQVLRVTFGSRSLSYSRQSAGRKGRVSHNCHDG